MWDKCKSRLRLNDTISFFLKQITISKLGILAFIWEKKVLQSENKTELQNRDKWNLLKITIHNHVRKHYKTK
jgi:hypothetical protein